VKNYKNSQKRILEDYGTYFVTTATFDRHPYFKSKVFCELFIEELRIVKELKRFLLFGFCIMPDHVHFLMKPTKCDLPEIIRSLKTNFSRNSRYIIEGDVTSRRLLFEKNNMINHYNYLIKLHYELRGKYLPKFQWQKSYHDHYIRNPKDFNNHLNYINTNHLKHNLSPNYKYIGYNYLELLDL
jgi:putative transposase